MQAGNWLEQKLGRWGGYVANHRRTVLGAAFLVTLISLPLAWRAVTHLDVNLFNQASDSLKRFKLMREFTEDFGGDLLAAVVTIPDNPTPRQVQELKAFGMLLAEELSKAGVSEEEQARLPAAMRAELRQRAAALAASNTDEPVMTAGAESAPPWLRLVECRTGQGIEQALKRIARQQPHVVLSPDDVAAFQRLFDPAALDQTMDRIAREIVALPPNSAEKLRLQTDPLGLGELAQSALAKRTQGRRQALSATDPDGFFLSPDQTTLVVLGRAALPCEKLDFSRALMFAAQRAENRALLAFRKTGPELSTALKGDVFAELAEAAQPGGLTVGFTGMSAVAVENELSLKYDLLGNTATSFVGVLLLFLIVFRKIRLAWDVTWTTVVVIVWTLAFAGVSRGSISVLGGAFTCILLGTGTDYAIHLHNSFHLFRHGENQSLEDALRNTLLRCGPGIITASLTTSLAFFGIGFTRFNGLAEFGLLAGVSIVLGCVMMLTVFPALLCRESARETTQGMGFGLRRWGEILSLPWVKPALLGFSALLLAGAVLFIRHSPDPGPDSVLGVRFDPELGNLRSLRIKAIPLRDRLAERFKMGLADMRVIVEAETEDMAFAGAGEVARRLKPFIDAKELTPGGSVLDYIPSAQSQAASIAALGAFDFNGAIASFKAAAQKKFGGRGPAFFEPFYKRLEDFRALSAGSAKTLTLSAIMNGPLANLLAPYVKLDDAPDGSSASAKAARPRVRLASSWFPARLDMPQDWYNRVAQSLETDPPAGVKINITAARMVGLEMKDSLMRDCGWISLIVAISVAIALGAAFRSLTKSFLAVIPLLYAYAALLAGVTLSDYMHWGFSLNFINLIMFPLLLGSGIDVGIYMVIEALSSRRPPLTELMADTGRSVLCCTLTTLVGFGSFFWSSYTGLISLGAAAIFGYIGALFGALVVLPALLGLLMRKNEAAS
jgi:predicted RND superfamily exporter protein